MNRNWVIMLLKNNDEKLCRNNVLMLGWLIAPLGLNRNWVLMFLKNINGK